MTGQNDELLPRKWWSQLRALWERIGESLFFVPSLFLIGAIILSQSAIAVDRALGSDDLPLLLSTTVDSSRVLLSVIAGGTITAASVVFSLTLVAVQLASTQFSPRILGAFLGDRVQQIIIGLVLGTFLYCLLVLHVVRAPVDGGGDPLIPSLSVALALALGVFALVAVIASINRTAQSLRVETVAAKVTAESIAAIEDQFGSEGPVLSATVPVVSGDTADVTPPDDAVVVIAPRSGWIQDINLEQLLGCVGEGSHVLVHRSVGNYVLLGQLLASVWPEKDDPDRVEREAAGGFVIARQRSRRGDAAFGITQLVDIAVRALSPGVNDPKTAEEMVHHLGEILVELAVRDLPPRHSEIDGRTIIRAAELAHRDYVELAVEPIRRFARTDPQVLASVVRTLATATAVAKRRRADAAVAAFDEQIELILRDTSALTSQTDRDMVVRTAEAVRAGM